MFIIIPVGHESNEVRRLPWITFGIMAICLIVHIFLSMDVGAKEEKLWSSAEEYITYYFNHPYLELNPEISAFDVSSYVSPYRFALNQATRSGGRRCR